MTIITPTCHWRTKTLLHDGIKHHIANLLGVMAQNLLGGFVSRYKGGSNASNFSSKVCVISLLITIDEDLENRN